MFRRLDEAGRRTGPGVRREAHQHLPGGREGRTSCPARRCTCPARALFPLTISPWPRRLRQGVRRQAAHLLLRRRRRLQHRQACLHAGIWPITMATTVLKPGGYQRFTQIGGHCWTCWTSGPSPAWTWPGMDALADVSARRDNYHLKPIKPLPRPEAGRKRCPCWTASPPPAEGGCPIRAGYSRVLSELCRKGKYAEALALITEKQPPALHHRHHLRPPLPGPSAPATTMTSPSTSATPKLHGGGGRI